MNYERYEGDATAAYKAGMRKTVSIVEHWRECHKRRQASSPDNKFIKCEIDDLEELIHHLNRCVLATSTHPKATT